MEIVQNTSDGMRHATAAANLFKEGTTEAVGRQRRSKATSSDGGTYLVEQRAQDTSEGMLFTKTDESDKAEQAVGVKEFRKPTHLQVGEHKKTYRDREQSSKSAARILREEIAQHACLAAEEISKQACRTLELARHALSVAKLSRKKAILARTRAEKAAVYEPLPLRAEQETRVWGSWLATTHLLSQCHRPARTSNHKSRQGNYFHQL